MGRAPQHAVMPAFAAPIEVTQAALHRIGEDELQSLDDNASAARVHLSNYEGIVRAYFARHAWSFATKTVDLTRIGAVTMGHWTSNYAWPAEVMNIRSVSFAPDENGYGARRLRSGEFVVQDGKVLTRGDSDLQAVVTIRAHESAWPGDFSEAVVTRLQGLYLEALCDKPQDGRIAKRDAEMMIRDAIVRDKRQSPGVQFDTVPLAESWRGAWGRRRLRNG